MFLMIQQRGGTLNCHLLTCRCTVVVAVKTQTSQRCHTVLCMVAPQNQAYFDAFDAEGKHNFEKWAAQLNCASMALQFLQLDIDMCLCLGRSGLSVLIQSEFAG